MGIFSKKQKAKPKTAPHAEEAAVSASRPVPVIAAVGRRVLVRPHTSEKAVGLEPKSAYVFLVRDDATKNLVREEVERRYKVKVLKVNIVRHRRERRFFRGVWHEGNITKKALVTLAPGARIELK